MSVKKLQLFFNYCSMSYPFRFFGSYEAVYGGWAGNAFTTLTGGVAEKVKTCTNDPDYPVVSPQELFTRVHNALTCGSIVSATVYAAPSVCTPLCFNNIDKILLTHFLVTVI